MKKRKLNYTFHDPNPPGAVANYLLKVMLEANTGKVEQALREAAGQQFDDERSAL